jgi:phosphoglycerol transferase MdoB-like AlkP superfamily enzyme
MEANKILSKQVKPFFAIIQTSDNHRPYTIPEADKKEFKKLSGIPTDTLSKYGFESIEELNAFRYTDFCFQKFMETAAKEKYMSNTLFVFVGDHGIRSKSIIPFFPQSWFNQGLACEHVPLLFYFPQLLQPQRVSTIASQVDILPTIAGMINVSYTNTGMGKDLYKNPGDNNFAFIIDHDTKQIGVVHDNYYFGRHLTSASEDFVSIINNDQIQKNPHTDSIRAKMSFMTDAFYETARYLLLNNRKKK